MITIVITIIALSLLYNFYPVITDKIVPKLGFVAFKETDTSLSKKHLSDIPEERKAWLVEKEKLDSFSANNVLSFTGNRICDGKKIQNESDEPDHNDVITWDFNHDCGMNPQYLKSMCLQRRYTNKERLCSSLVDIVQRPQDPNNPKNFTSF